MKKCHVPLIPPYLAHDPDKYLWGKDALAMMPIAPDPTDLSRGKVRGAV